MPNVNDNPPFDPVGNGLGPNNRVEAYLGVIGGLENHELPSAPSSRVEAYLEHIANQPRTDPRVDEILELIPDAASPENQLGDKEFINSSIATQTAHYIYKTNQSGDKLPFDSVAELEAYTGTVTPNDYAFVTGVDTDGNRYFDRYKYTENEDTGEYVWAKEYRLNNSSFTAAQWSAINSGITVSLVQLISEQKVYMVNYADPNYTEATAAFNAGKLVVLRIPSGDSSFTSGWYVGSSLSAVGLQFRAIEFDYVSYKNIKMNVNRSLIIYYAKVPLLTSNDTWSNTQYSISITGTSLVDTAITSSSTDTTLPTSKAVYNALAALPIPADKIYIVNYANPNYTDALAAYNAGKLVFTFKARTGSSDNFNKWYIATSVGSDYISFNLVNNELPAYLQITRTGTAEPDFVMYPAQKMNLSSTNTWSNSQETGVAIPGASGNIITATVNSSSPDTKLPTAKAVKDAIDAALESIDEEDWVFKLDATTTVTKHVKVREN